LNFFSKARNLLNGFLFCALIVSGGNNLLIKFNLPVFSVSLELPIISIVCESEGRQSVLSDLLINHKHNPNPVAHWQDFLNSSQSLCITNHELTEGLLTVTDNKNFAIEFFFKGKEFT
jgi:hypothetical protein